jgi:hypothetical protein
LKIISYAHAAVDGFTVSQDFPEDGVWVIRPTAPVPAPVWDHIGWARALPNSAAAVEVEIWDESFVKDLAKLGRFGYGLWFSAIGRVRTLPDGSSQAVVEGLRPQILGRREDG